MLSNVRVVDIYDDVESLLMARLICESDENYPKDVLHVYTEKEPTRKRNEAICKLIA